TTPPTSASFATPANRPPCAAMKSRPNPPPTKPTTRRDSPSKAWMPPNANACSPPGGSAISDPPLLHLFSTRPLLSIAIHQQNSFPSMNADIATKTVALLATNGFESSEVFQPLDDLREAGATVKIVSPESGKICGWKSGQWGREVDVDVTLDKARAEDFDALVLPGGVLNPDTLRQDERAVKFVRGFF